jgi:hypothetical protein
VRDRVVSLSAFLLTLGAGLAVACWPMWRSHFALMQCDPADTRHLNFVLEWGHRWLTGHAALWSPPFFFPERNVGAYTEVLLGLVPFYSAFRLVGLEPDSAFQAWTIATLTLNVVIAWLLFHEALTFGAFASAVGTFMLCFGGVRLNQLNHQHLLPHFFTFLAVHALVRLFTTAQPRRWLLVLTASAVLQVYCGVQLGWMLLFVLAIAFGWAMTLRPSRARVLEVMRPNVGLLAALGVASAVALWPLAHPYLAAGRDVGFRQFADMRGFLPWAQSWLYQGPHNWLYGRFADLHLFTQQSTEGEQRLGLGPVTTIVLLVGLWKARAKPWVAVLKLTAFSIIALTTTHGRFNPWQAVMAVVPGANSIRAVGRIALLLLLPAGIGLASIAKARPSWSALLLFCLLEQGQQVPDAYDKQSMRDEVEVVTHAVPSRCDSFFWAPRATTVPNFDPVTQLDAMWAALALGVPTVNGYSSNFPRDWALLEHAIATPADEARLRDALQRWDDTRNLETCFVTR